MKTPCKMPQKSQMLLRKTIQNTKIVFLKTLQKLKAFLLDGYPKLPKTFIIRKMFYRSNGNRKSSESDFWQSTIDVMDSAILLQKMEYKEREPGECSGSTISESVSDISVPKGREQVARKMANRQDSKRRVLSSPSIERKLKQLEMLEPSDVEHVLDIEEVLHYYSRLTSPVYVDIVDTFCTEMYNEYSHPHSYASISADNSMRRSGSMRKSGSMRRLGPVKL